MITNLIWWIIVGLIAGWAAGKIMKGGGYGVVIDIVLGIVGALVLNAILYATIGYTYYGWIGQLIVGAVGAIVLIFLYRVVTSRNP